MERFYTVLGFTEIVAFDVVNFLKLVKESPIPLINNEKNP
jgi:hypothetical protein